jgi:hypothetical protein
MRRMKTNKLALLAVTSALLYFGASTPAQQGPSAQGTPLEQWSVHSYEPTAPRLVYTAARSLGMLRGVRERDFLVTYIYRATGTMYQAAATPSWPAITLEKYTAEVSYEQDRGMRVDFVTGGKRQVQVVAGAYAWDENDVPSDGPPVGKSQTSMPAAVRERQLNIAISPYGAIKAAHLNIDKVTVTALEHGTFALTFPYMGDTMKVTLDRNRRPAKVEVGIKHPILGKTTLEADYSGYKDFEGRGVSGVFFPTKIVQKIGGRTVLDIEVSSAKCVNPYVLFPIPESIGGTATAAQHNGE